MKKILIVEDDPLLMEIYQKKFVQQGYLVEMAASGVEAEKKIEELQPDLVLLDLVLPEEDGFEVLKRIKENKAVKNSKIVIFSNLSQEEDRKKAIQLGADGFIAKSDFTPQQVVDQVEALFKNYSFDKKNFQSENLAMGSIVDQELSDEKKILVVDDDEVFTKVLKEKLADLGWEVDLVKDSISGLDLAKENSYELIILSLNLPSVDGLVFLKEMSAAVSPKGTSIAVLSNVDEDVDLLKKAGASEFYLKTSITPLQLVDIVSDLIGKK